MTIGIIGGGQLGLMIAEEAIALGAKVIALDPAKDAPVFTIVDKQIVAAYDDIVALEELCSQSDVVTYEFENVPSELLVELDQKYNIKQGVKPLFDSQDRYREKVNAQENGLKTPRFEIVDSENSLKEAVEKLGYPCVLKTRTLGYDGHGQCVIKSEKDIANANCDKPSILEEFVKFDYEVSVVLVADDEKIISFPVGQNIHRQGILDLSIVPASMMSKELEQKIVQQSKEFMQKCGYRGILAIEYFVKGEEIYFNEMAPRPHNSGHYTIEGCSTNQYRELCRYLLSLQLQGPKLLKPTVMKNILGEDLEVAKQIEQQENKNTFVHLYGKSESRPKRKMGHITFTDMTIEKFEKEWKNRFIKAE